MRKKFFILFSLGMMVFALSACNSADNSASGDAGNHNTEVHSDTDSANVDTDTDTDTLPEQVADSRVEQTLAEYIAAQNKTPRYFVVNPYYVCLDELSSSNLLHLLQNNIVIAYFGDQMIPYPGEKVAIIQTFLGEDIYSKSLEEIIETLKGSSISQIIELPIEIDTIVSEFTSAEEIETASTLVVGKKLESLIDISEYNSALTMLDYTDKPEHLIKLPFNIYKNTTEAGLWSAYGEEQFSKCNYLRSIPGNTNTVMIVKMDNASTYDLILRIPYNKSNYCALEDLGSFRVLAKDLTEEQVERMVDANEQLTPNYAFLVSDPSRTLYEGQLLREYIATQTTEPRYFIFNPSKESYEELSPENKMHLHKASMVYVYFGKAPVPQENEEVVMVETFFGADMGQISAEGMTYEGIIELIKTYTITTMNKLQKNPLGAAD